MAIVQQGEFHDTRLPINRLRRFDLWKICDYYKITYDNSRDTAQSLVRRILDAGVNAEQHIRRTKNGGQEFLLVDLPAPDQGKKDDKVVKEVEMVDKEVVKSVKPKQKIKKVYATYEEMKVFELRSLCKEKGIPWTHTEKKTSLIEKLNSFNDQKVLSGQTTGKL